MRTGSDYLAAIADDGRAVYVDGEAVGDVTRHPAFAGVARTIAGLFDFAAEPANEMTYTAPETGGPANRTFLLPRSADELRLRREAVARWARRSCGFVGRGPDHVAGFVAGFASAPAVFDAPGHDLAVNVTRYRRRMLAESRFASYTIIPPQVSGGRDADGAAGEPVQVYAKEERDGGIVVRGAQMLGTSTALSDDLFVSCIKPLAPDDERHALSFVVPVAARGLKVYCRRPYATGQPSTFDAPLSTRYDESDALIVFDDVFVPWEDVFVYRDVERLRRQWFDTGAHVLGNSQAQVRLATKLSFLAGLARRIAEVNGIDRIPAVQERLGELASIVALVEGMTLASEHACTTRADGVVLPHPRFLYGAMGLQAELYPRVVQIVRELVGGGVLQVPSSYRELVEPETAPDMERYLGGDGCSAAERVKLFKLAWDAIGSELGGRHQQYEMFYAGAPFVAKGYAFRNYGFEEALALVDEQLAGYTLPAAALAGEGAA